MAKFSSLGWCDITPSGGTGNATLTFKANEHTGRIKRSGSVYAHAGSLSKQITVTQNGAGVTMGLATSQAATSVTTSAVTSVDANAHDLYIFGKTNGYTIYTYLDDATKNTTNTFGTTVSARAISDTSSSYKTIALTADTSAKYTGNSITATSLGYATDTGNTGRTEAILFAVKLTIPANQTSSSITRRFVIQGKPNGSASDETSLTSAEAIWLVTQSAGGLSVTSNNISSIKAAGDSVTETLTTEGDWTISAS